MRLYNCKKLGFDIVLNYTSVLDKRKGPETTASNPLCILFYSFISVRRFKRVISDSYK